MKTQFNFNMFVAALSVSVLLASGGTSMANVALPAIVSAFDVSFARARWVALGYLVAITLFSLIVGRLGDVSGKVQILIGGALLFAAGSVLCGVSPNLWFLVLSRIIQGIGGAALVVLPLAIADEFLPQEQRGRIMGLLASMSAIGTVSGPSVGGFLLVRLGWRAPFFFLVIVAVLAIGLILKFVPFSRLMKAGERDRESFLAALWSLFSDSSIRVLLISNFVFSLVMMSTLITGPFFLTNGLHIGAEKMGLFMSVGPVTSMMAGYISGRLVERFGVVTIIKIGLIQLFVGSISFIFFPALLGASGFALSAALLSLGYQLSLAANSVRIMSVVEPEKKGFVAGALSLMRNLGLMSGTLLIGGVFDLFSKESPAKGLEAAFAVAAAFVSVLLINQLRNQKRGGRETGFIKQVC